MKYRISAEMASAVGLKGDEDYFDWSKGKYDYVDGWPVMSHPAIPLLILITYWLFVFKLGPQLMEKRPALKLTWILALYNFIQVIFSVYMTVIYSAHFWKHGFVHATCLMDDKPMALKINEYVWIYTMSKLSEFLDTIFFVLRKKYNQVSFLHVYHHSVVMSGAWVFLKYGATDNMVFLGLLNSAVHIIMYTYYGLAAFGPVFKKYLSWKKYITKLQLLQFLTMMIFLYSKATANSCSVPTWAENLFRFFVTTLLLLFSKFYFTSYKHKKIRLDGRSDSTNTAYRKK